MGDGGKDKFFRETLSWVGGNDGVVRADPVMCQPRAKCTDCEI